MADALPANFERRFRFVRPLGLQVPANYRQLAQHFGIFRMVGPDLPVAAAHRVAQFIHALYQIPDVWERRVLWPAAYAVHAGPLFAPFAFNMREMSRSYIPDHLGDLSLLQLVLTMVAFMFAWSVLRRAEYLHRIRAAP